MKVAIVCDWLSGTGGAERVVLELHKLYPDAPIYTSQYNSDPKIWYGDKWFAGADIRTAWLQKLPVALKKFLPVFRALYFSRLDLSDYDLVISSSGAEAKGVKPGPNTVHISYLHAPTHYYWARYNDYMKHPGFGLLNPLARLGLKLLVGPMRHWDYKAAQKPDFIIANSTFTKNQIKKYYGREAKVIFPPVDTERFKFNTGSAEARSGFVVAGRQTPYKKISLAVAACTKLNQQLTVIGNGPEHSHLEKIAGPSINFITDASDKEVARYFQVASAFIFPGVDDFGIVAVEALAAGTPIIAYKDGGVLDYVNTETGIFFEKQTVAGLVAVLTNFGRIKFDYRKVAAAAQEYNVPNFVNNMTIFINKVAKP